MKRSVLSTAFVVAVLALISGCPAAPPGPEPATAPMAVVTSPEHGGEVLYRDQWAGRDVRLLGVDTQNRCAWLWMAARRPRARLVIDTVDYASGRRVDRWEASADKAATIVNMYPRFRPLSGSLDEDLQRFAEIVRRSGPWHSRARKLSPTVVASPSGDGVIYDAEPTGGRDGDWLFLKTSAKPAVRIDGGNIASYAPTYAPDGSLAAFTGCYPKAPGKRDCSYWLFVSHLKGPPVRVPTVRKPTAPVFGPDGASIYTVGRSKGGHTLWEVDAHAPHSATAVTTTSGLDDVDFTLSPSGTFAVVGGMKGQPGQQVYEFVRIKLSDHTVEGGASIRGAVGVGISLSDTVQIVPTQRGGLARITFGVDRVALAPDAGASFLETARYDDDRGLVLLRRAADTVELIALDVEGPRFGDSGTAVTEP